MKNLRLLSLVGLFVIFCTENVISAAHVVQQPFVLQPDAFVRQIANAALAGNNTQINQLLEDHPNYPINQTNPQGQTPLQLLLSKLNVQVDHVTLLLDLGADILAGNETPGNVRTSLHVAAGLNNQRIFRLFIKKILLDSLTAAIAEAGVPLLSLPPYNLAAPPNINVLQHNDTNLEHALSTVLECYDFSNSSILQANLNGLHFGLRGVAPEHTPAPAMESIRDFISVLKAYIVAPDRPAMESIEYFINVLKAYIHVNNLNIDSETLGNFNIHLRALNGKSLLQLAGDRRNTRLVSCICSRIYTPWTLRRLSRAPGTKWKDPMYDALQHNDEIKQTIRTRYWSLCLFLGGGLTTVTTVGFIFQGTISAFLGSLLGRTVD